MPRLCRIFVRAQPWIVLLSFERGIVDDCQLFVVKFLQFLPAVFVTALVILLTGCETPRKLVTDPAPSAMSGDSDALPAIYDPKPVSVLHGKASFYGKPQPTASGERFNPRAMTAAHKTLPMHTVVRVVNLRNFKSVIVRINDRGPYIRGRIIDLSTASAEKISMIGAGVVPVRVEVLRKIEILQKPNRKVSSLPPTRSALITPAAKPAAKRSTTGTIKPQEKPPRSVVAAEKKAPAPQSAKKSPAEQTVQSVPDPQDRAAAAPTRKKPAQRQVRK